MGAGLIPPYKYSPELASLMVTEWTNFAKGRFLPDRPSWPAFQVTRSPRDMHFEFDWPSEEVPGAGPGLRQGWQVEQCKLWNALNISSLEDEVLMVTFCLAPKL